ncbi:MAG: UbiA family prenyltransferase, partial [Chitinophagales bacterium]
MILPFFKLVRWLNLVYIVLTQYLIRYCIILPLYAPQNDDFVFEIAKSSLQEWQFALLVFSTVCIAAAGYIINDYFDIKTDTINKRNRVVIGYSIPRQLALNMYFF